MTLDAYALCPGGTGKKIKHCACKDITGELEKIIRAMEGNQRIAALDRINRTLATKAHRPCLLALKAATLLGMKDLQDFEETVTTYVKVAPANPLALAFATLLEVRKNRVRQAVDRLQEALAVVTEEFPLELYRAIGIVGQALAKQGQYLAARGHLFFHAMLQEEDEESTRTMLTVNSHPSMPATLKFHLYFAPPPADVSWKTRMTSVMRQCARGLWKKGLEGFERLNQEFPGQAVILKNIALARSYLGHPDTAAAWRAYAQTPGLALDEAVEAEAVAQSLEYSATRRTTGVVKLTYTVSDAQVLRERLSASPHFAEWPAQAPVPTPAEGPPPKTVFSIVSPSMPPAGTELTLENAPRLLCEALLFGRETDREARLEVIVPQADGAGGFERAQELLAEVGGDVVAADPSEELVGAQDTWGFILHSTFRFPPGTPVPVRVDLGRQYRNHAITHIWPTLPLAVLDDKTPQQVADDPNYRVRLLAALLTLEQQLELEGFPSDCDPIREQLGLPLRGTVEAASTAYMRLNPVQWARLAPAPLDDQDLINLWHASVSFGLRRAMWNVGNELLQRGDAIGEQIDKQNVCGTLIALAEASEDWDSALALTKQAQAMAKAAGNSVAPWLLREIDLRFSCGDAEGGIRLIHQVRAQFGSEPEIMNLLLQILQRWGLIPSDGSGPARPPLVKPIDEPQQKIWTPDSAAAAGDREPERKLWVPD